LGRSPKALGRSPKALGRSPKALGRSPKALGRSPKALGRSPKALGHSPKRLEKPLKHLRNTPFNNFNPQFTMPTKDYIPRKDDEFSTWARNLINYLNMSAQRFGFPSQELAELNVLYEDFRDKLEIAETPETRTSAAIKSKTEAHDLLEKVLRQNIKESLTYNHLVTDEDRENMGLPIHKTTHTPAPIAKTFPEFDVDTGVIRRLVISFYDQGKKKSKAKPDGQHGVELRWAVLTAPPTKLDELVHSTFNTHTPIVLEFDEDQRGKTIYFCICWENTRGEKGPRSNIVNAIIP
jgi:hypothetical protein